MIKTLCRVDDIEEPGAKGFEFEEAGSKYNLFVVRKDDELRAYKNSCPHTNAPLEWMPDQFLDMDNSFIMCAIHGALFRVDDGYCLRGPCAGMSLQALPLTVSDGEIQVDIANDEAVS